MNKLLTLIILIILLTACGPGDSSQSAFDEEAVAQAAAEGIEVTFTEEECVSLGPELLPAGEYTFVFKDLTGNSKPNFYVNRIGDGKTYQDVIELQGDVPGGSDYPMPEWITYAKTVDYESDPSTGEKRATYALEEGEYYVDAFKNYERSWLCGGMTVLAE